VAREHVTLLLSGPNGFTFAPATSGALLLHRPRLARLAEQDPDLLARLPIPLIVVP